jgi:hypothetical protein
MDTSAPCARRVRCSAEPRELLGVVRAGGARPRRLRADVDDLGALAHDHRVDAGVRRASLSNSAPVGERVRRPVQHPHEHDASRSSEERAERRHLKPPFE